MCVCVFYICMCAYIINHFIFAVKLTVLHAVCFRTPYPSRKIICLESNPLIKLCSAK